MTEKTALDRKIHRSANFLFVYGTLRRGCSHPMARLLAQHASHLGKARMPGRLYKVSSYPGAVQDGADGWVIGDVFQLRKPVRLLEKLDRYEGCGRGQSLNPLFVRRMLEVQLNDARPLSAWVYLYNRAVAGLPEIQGGDFLAIRGLARAGIAVKP